MKTPKLNLGINEGGTFMKYIRTKDGRIIDLSNYKEDKVFNGDMRYINKINGGYTFFHNIIKQADTIEELCDASVLISLDYDTTPSYFGGEILPLQDYCEIHKDYEIYGAIWTDKGLIYVAKMNKKGELELL